MVSFVAIAREVCGAYQAGQVVDLAKLREAARRLHAAPRSVADVELEAAEVIDMLAALPKDASASKRSALVEPVYRAIHFIESALSTS